MSSTTPESRTIGDLALVLRLHADHLELNGHTAGLIADLRLAADLLHPTSALIEVGS